MANERIFLSVALSGKMSCRKDEGSQYLFISVISFVNSNTVKIFNQREKNKIPDWRSDVTFPGLFAMDKTIPYPVEELQNYWTLHG